MTDEMQFKEIQYLLEELSGIVFDLNRLQIRKWKYGMDQRDGRWFHVWRRPYSEGWDVQDLTRKDEGINKENLERAIEKVRAIREAVLTS